MNFRKITARGLLFALAATVCGFFQAAAQRATTGKGGEVGIQIKPYLYIQESEGGAGGMRRPVQVIYLDADGMGQISQEGSDDTVETLLTSTVRADDFLREVAKFQFPPPVMTKESFSHPRPILSEFLSGAIYFETRTGGGKEIKWSVSPHAKSDAVASIARKALEIVLRGESLTTATCTRYIRASLLTPSTVKELRRAGNIHEVSVMDAEREPLLKLALTHPGRLVPLPAGENPYISFGQVFAQGRSVQVSIINFNFQVRNLIKALIQNRKGERK